MKQLNDDPWKGAGEKFVIVADEDEIFSLETNKHAEALDTFKIHK